MKRVISIILLLATCFSLCACGDSGPHPLSVDFQTEDELIEALEEYFGSDKWDKYEGEKRDEMVAESMVVLNNNTAIHHYFQKSDEAVALAYTLSDYDSSVGSYFTLRIFEACNTNKWYEGIPNEMDVLGIPHFTETYYDDKPTCENIADAIRENFVDPLSVTVLSGDWSFVAPVDGLFEVPLEYIGVVDVRATNKFGAYVTQEYVIKGTIKGNVSIIKEYNGNTISDRLKLCETYGAIKNPIDMD